MNSANPIEGNIDQPDRVSETGTVLYVDADSALLFTRDSETNHSHLWQLDVDTALLADGKLLKPVDLRKGDKVHVFAELVGERLVATRIERDA